MVHDQPADTPEDVMSTAECAGVLRAMGNETRLSILRCLFERRRSVTEICEALEIEQYVASRHLAVLRNAGLVDNHRDGQRVIYALHPNVRRTMADRPGSIELGCCQVTFPID